MGASTSWIAVKGKPIAAVLENLGLRVADPQNPTEKSVAEGCVLSDGWYVIALKGYEHRFTRREILERLSAGAEVVAGGVETHVMCSTATGWRDGQEVWWVEHDNDAAEMDLRTRGVMPNAFAGIRDKLTAEETEGGEHSGVDYLFDVPVELTAALTGYDFDNGQPGEVWESLVSLKKSWWNALFGR
jgi:hypothetical protein